MAAYPPDPDSNAPTQVRYGVLAFLCLLSFILYIDRICISQAAPDMQEELGLSNTLMGYVFGAFAVAYGLFEVPTGRWGDRFGSVTDPFGHSWGIATHVEDVPPDEMERRAAEFMGAAAAGS